MRNKKGFTLVELLAVIVILALIMSIAVISIGGVLQSTRQSTFKETAASIIDGVQKQLLVANELSEGNYYFANTIVEKGGEESPLGGKINYYSGSTGQIGTSPVYRVNSEKTNLECGNSSTSFVHVKYDTDTYKYTYTICLTAGTATEEHYYIYNGELTKLLDSKDTSMIYYNGSPIKS